MESLSSIKSQSWLSWFLRGILFLIFLVILTRLTELQIIRGSYFRGLSENNRIRRVPIVAPRGKIIAQGGEILVGNKEVERKIIFDPKSGYEKTDDITNATGIDVIHEWIRDYKLGEEFAHVSGYLGEVSVDEVGKTKAQCPEKGPLNPQELIGRSGLEAQYDCTLRGIDGEELVEVDASGKKVRTLGRKEPVPGEDITTTIDYGFQKVVAESMSGKQGAVVIADMNGGIIAMVSTPSYDPNLFNSKVNSDKISALLKDESKPLFNRVISGTYQPGSIFKPIVSAAALESGTIDKDFTYTDTGSIVVGDFVYRNWYMTQYGGAEGSIGLTRALARSTDTFFYKIGELTGIDNIVYWASKFGLDKETGIDLPGESKGLVPSPDWKLKVKGERWYLGNTYHVAIGQGDLGVTPIEMVRAISVIASGGKFCTPYLVKQTKCQDVGIKQSTTALIKEGMIGACSPGGTGYTFFDFKDKTNGLVQPACKTGTAQVDEGDSTHAWFTIFAPAENPQIVATILVEKGGEGSKEAGPIARKIFDYWFNVQNISPTITPMITKTTD